jgi:hypothetical protein
MELTSAGLMYYSGISTGCFFGLFCLFLIIAGQIKKDELQMAVGCIAIGCVAITGMSFFVFVVALMWHILNSFFGG